MKTVKLNHGKEAIIDDEDLDLVSTHKWQVSTSGYAVRVITHPHKPGKRLTLFMHRVILGLEIGNNLEGDHINRDKLDNRRANLRVATRSENCMNKGPSKANRSGFKGVRFSKRDKKWVSYIKINGKSIYLGGFYTAEDGFRAYCKAASEMHGKFKNFGMPEDVAKEILDREPA